SLGKANVNIVLPITWLIGREDHVGWSFVWKALLEQREALPESLPLKELLLIGATWLNGREKCDGWTFVWTALLEQREALPESLPLRELLLIGATWLNGREDCDGWPHVCHALLAHPNDLPKDLSLSELSQSGATWLTGREKREGWVRVWRALLAHPNVLPESLSLNELLLHGFTWLNGHEEHAGWSFVWTALFEQRETLSKSLPLSKLLLIGATWLNGREERDGWVHVCHALLADPNALPESLSLNELCQRGAAWLNGREERDGWSHLLQAVLKHPNNLPDSMPLSELLLQGTAWLDRHEERDEWAHLWQSLLEHQNSLPKSLPLSELLQRGTRWLSGHDYRVNEWGFVCERLLELKHQNEFFLTIAADWLTKARERAEWPLLAAKFIVAAPHHSASIKFAETLTERINASPNKGWWHKTQPLVAELIAHESLPLTIRDWLQVLSERKSLPAWKEAYQSLNQGFPIEGRAIRSKGSGQIIELKNGLISNYLVSPDNPKITKNEVRDFFVQFIDLDKDSIQVTLFKTAQLVNGEKYNGHVREYRSYGALIAINGHQGLLHRNRCSNWAKLVSKHSIGSQICVEIVSLTHKGPQLRYAGPELTIEGEEVVLSVGRVYNADICGIKEYGLFLQVGGHFGLLHRTHLPPNTDILSQYLIDQKLEVQLVEIKSDGKLVLKLPDQ
ncbi:RNA-binding protein, partial [Pseudoalteromonas sp. S2721]|uniref:S1 RNA-binding domain-containing protein n=1 Tax=Pseudoalteromonas sp. S2721 TaxID=579526 RepID=UPI00110BDCA4